MIPRKIELKNFLSYGDQLQSIDLTKHSLVCLSGKNGNGKSALLDALTWAIWGQARKLSTATKPDEGLLRSGQTRMVVSVEFDFNQKIYRVRREFAKTYGRPYLALNFEIYNETQDKFLSLMEKSTRQTQEKIEQTLGLDYETFINSAFLRQGQSNEFSKKSPKERKTILANILGLSTYDKLHQASLELVRKHIEEKKLLLHTEEQIAQELIKVAENKNFYVENQKKIIELNQEFESIQIELQKHQDLKNKLVDQKKEIVDLTCEIKSLYNQDAKKRDALSKLVLQWKKIHIKSLKVPDFTKLENEKLSLHKQEKFFFELRQEYLKLQEEIIRNRDLYQKRLALLECTFEKKINELKLATERSEFAITQNKKLVQQKKVEIKDIDVKLYDLNKESELLTKKFNGMILFDEAVAKIKAQFEKRRTFYQSLIERGNFIKSEKLDLEQRKSAVQDINNPACPFCEQMLTAKRKHFLNSKLIKSETFLVNRLNRITSVIKKLKVILIEQHKQFQNIEKEVEIYRQLKIRSAEVDKNILECKQIIAVKKRELIELEKNNISLEKVSNTDKDVLIQQEAIRLTHFAKDTELESFANQIAVKDLSVRQINEKLINYNKLQERLKNIENQIQEYSSFKQELSEQPQRRLLITLSISDIKKLRMNINSMQFKLEQLNVGTEQEAILDSKLAELKKLLSKITAQKEALIVNIGRTDNELKRLERLGIESLTRQDRIKLLDLEIEEYQTLATTFGKNGIQSLLIEQAIPEIEYEANKILAKLTDNQAQIFIESLKDLKSGGVRETLDIQISDSVGIRPYEMYSGGEAFRVDFAIRIAISKLLARRAGTALQTLIIDEGFGSQDDENLARVMNSILSIQNDFLKIIIVSHLSDFKDNFPIHFIIEKNMTGSVIRVEEKG